MDKVVVVKGDQITSSIPTKDLIAGDTYLVNLSIQDKWDNIKSNTIEVTIVEPLNKR